MTKPLNGEIAIVTGASGGIGSAIGKRLMSDGAKVIGCGSRAPDGFDFGVGFDLSDDQAVFLAAEDVVENVGHPSIIVHAAALSVNANTRKTSPGSFLDIYNVNVVGAVRLVQAFAPHMCEVNHGSITFISSINSQFGTPSLSAYAASKGGLDSLTKTLALELAPHKIRVNAISPASVDTSLLRHKFELTDDPSAAEIANINRHPLGRLGTPSDIANFVSFIVSDEAAWMTGGVHLIDGGAHITRR